MQKLITGNLHDLFKDDQTDDKEREGYITECFGGLWENNNPLFRIPAADTGTEILFDNLVVLSRFANMPLQGQEAFCRRVRAVIGEAGIDTLHLTVEWSESETKVLKIRLINNHHLNIYVV